MQGISVFLKKTSPPFGRAVSDAYIIYVWQIMSIWLYFRFFGSNYEFYMLFY